MKNKEMGVCKSPFVNYDLNTKRQIAMHLHPTAYAKFKELDADFNNIIMIIERVPRNIIHALNARYADSFLHLPLVIVR
jgi:hypothetical protein